MKKRSQSLSRYLFIFLVLSLFSVQVFAQNSVDVTDLFLSPESFQQNLSEQSQNLNNGNLPMNNNSLNSTQLENNQKTSSSESMNPSELLDKQMSLLDELEMQFSVLEKQLAESETHLNNSELQIKSLQSQLENCKIKILDLQRNLGEYNQALLSNKDDTSYIIGLLGEAAEKAEKLEIRIHELEIQSKQNFWFSTVGISLLSLAPVAIGAVEYCKGDQYGKDYMWAGLGIFLSAQLIYQGGHWIFQLW